MKDVAALAGVSVSTVSNALNAPERLTPATLDRIQASIKELGWVRNESARQLRAGSSLAVGVVVMDLGNPFFTDVIAGVEEFCYGRGLSVHVGHSGQSEERQALLLRRFEEQRVRGVIVAPIDDDPGLEEARGRNLPIVLVDRANNPSFCCVGTDDVAGGLTAARHLLDQGHRRLAFVGGPATLTQILDRRRGAEAAVEAVAGASLDVIDTPGVGIKAGVDAAAKLAAIEGDERPTGVFAANDLVAIGLLQGFTTAGLKVPDDIGLIGYDDIVFAAASAVPLSSIRQSRHELGLRAAGLLWDEIEAQEAATAHEHRVVKLAPTLVARRSTGA
jgi:LacI family transcriptional regulator